MQACNTSFKTEQNGERQKKMKRLPMLRDWKGKYCENSIVSIMPALFFTEIKKDTLKFKWKHKWQWSSWTSDMSGCITIPDLKLCHRSIVIRSLWYCPRNSYIGHWDRTEDVDRNPLKWGSWLNKEFSPEEYRMAEKHLKKCSASSIIREMQIKTILRFYLTPVGTAKIKNSGYSRCWRGCGERERLLQRW